MKVFEKYQLVFHIVGWSLVFFLPLLVMPNSFYNRPEFSRFFTVQCFNNLALMAAFYINLLVLVPKFLMKKRGDIFSLYIILGFVIILALHWIWSHYFLKMHGFDMGMPKMPPPSEWKNRPNNMPRPPRMFLPFPQLMNATLTYFFSIIFSTSLALWQERLRNHDLQQQILLEKVAAELAVLKLQVSPHFLFNTLNNIRWLARKKSENTEDAIVKLSQLLRYMLYQSESDKVPLTQELDYLQNYIELQKMRISGKNSAEFSYEGPIHLYSIEPLLFIPLVENAFKYGLHSIEESHILIKLSVENDTLRFITENRNFDHNFKEEDKTGIGLQNVKKRLALHYPEKHELKITENGLFIVEVYIQL